MKIYTREGDRGQTRLPGAAPVSKDSPTVEACGTIDELGAAIGLARCESLPDELDPLLDQIQRGLLQLNSELADPGRQGDAAQAIGPGQIAELEAAIDGYEPQLETLRAFILPGKSHAEAALHFARTICRRAERRVVSLARAEPHRVSGHHLAYLNRLGDLLFVLARFAVAR